MTLLKHLGNLSTFMIPADTCISVKMTEKDQRNHFVCRHAGAL